MGQYVQAAMMVANMIQSSQQTKSQQADAMAKQRADIQQRQYQLQIQEREKRARLKRAEATQRSRFGAQGLGSNSGSATALLAGLHKETEQSIADMHGLNNMRTSHLLEQSARNKRTNLLEQRNNLFRKGMGTMVNLLELK